MAGVRLQAPQLAVQALQRADAHAAVVQRQRHVRRGGAPARLVQLRGRGKAVGCSACGGTLQVEDSKGAGPRAAQCFGHASAVTSSLPYPAPAAPGQPTALPTLTCPCTAHCFCLRILRVSTTTRSSLLHATTRLSPSRDHATDRLRSQDSGTAAVGLLVRASWNLGNRRAARAGGRGGLALWWGVLSRRRACCAQPAARWARRSYSPTRSALTLDLLLTLTLNSVFAFTPLLLAPAAVRLDAAALIPRQPTNECAPVLPAGAAPHLMLVSALLLLAEAMMSGWSGRHSTLVTVSVWLVYSASARSARATPQLGSTVHTRIHLSAAPRRGASQRGGAAVWQ